MRYWIRLLVAAVSVGFLAAGAKAYLPQQSIVTQDFNTFVQICPKPPTGCLPVWDGYNGVITKTVVAPTISAGRNLFLIVAGEGNSASIAPTQYTPVNSGHVFNINVFDGGIYAGADPLLGATAWGLQSGTSTDAQGNTVGPGLDQGACGANCGANGGWPVRLADMMISDGIADNVYLANLSLYGSDILGWAFGGLSPGAFEQRVLVMCSRMAALGVAPNAFLFGQGESNNGGMSRFTYSAATGNLAQAIRGIGLQTPLPTCAKTVGVAPFPMFLAKESYVVGAGVDPEIQAGQALAVDNINIFAGPNIDSITSAHRTGPACGTYLDDSGMDIAARLWRSTLYTYGKPF